MYSMNRKGKKFDKQIGEIEKKLVGVATSCSFRKGFEIKKCCLVELTFI